MISLSKRRASLLPLPALGATLLRTGAAERLLQAAGVGRVWRVVLRLLGAPLALFGRKGDPTLPPLPRALMAMGPSYIKLGQVLSTRADIVGEALAQELRLLQDKLPPFGQDQAMAEIARAFGQPAQALFAQLDPPIAAASIAQVHRAVLRDSGKVVAVKILRPQVEQAFARDIRGFYAVAKLVHLLIPAARRLRPLEVVDHFAGVVAQEMDLRLEAAAADELAKTIAAAGIERVRVPAVYWPLTARRVIAFDWVEAGPCGDVEALRAAGHDMPALAARVMTLFLTNALYDGYFHADMHQGNLRITPDGTLVLLDFGIMGRLSREVRRTYAEILLGFVNRDYYAAAEAHVVAGYVPRGTDVFAFANALRSIGEPIFGQRADQISMARLLQQLFDVTERFGMETQTDLILLQRTMIVVEGVARSFDPQFDMWAVARPVLERWVRDHLGPRGFLRDTRLAIMTLARIGPRLPQLAERLVQLAEAQQPPQTAAPRAPVWKWIALGLLMGNLAFYFWSW